MERLTAKENGHYYYPRCFEWECDGASERCEECELEEEVCERLGQYEDIGMSPDEIVGKLEALADHNGWIPVDEHLPKESLDSMIGWDDYRNRCVFVQYYNGRWVLGKGMESVKIVAWHPLPGPYHTEGKRN